VIQKAGREHAENLETAAPCNAWRIQVKKPRYAADFLSSLYEQKAGTRAYGRSVWPDCRGCWEPGTMPLLTVGASVRMAAATNPQDASESENTRRRHEDGQHAGPPGH
jgi:hypothetical protein